MISNDKKLTAIRHNIKVDTVDSYQGKENSIIIVSTVRNNTRKKSGFLKSDSRVNVALSRAQDHLVVFGSRRLWESLPDLPLGKTFAHVRCEGIPIVTINSPFDGGDK